MSNRFRQLLAEISRPEPPRGLLHAVLSRVAFEKRRQALKRKLAFHAVLTTALVAALAWSIVAAVSVMAGSGNLQYLSLAFTDTGIVLANWSMYATTVLESLPVGHLAELLSLTFVLLFASRALIRVSRQALEDRNHAVTI
jgi:hypothetical protein